MSDDKQQLNSLDRFRKRSDRLVLEQYHSCEVPAGCGGVVLRWRDPNKVRPTHVYLYTQSAAECYLDGAALRAGLLDLSPGDHVLAIHMESADLHEVLVSFAAVSRSKQSRAGPATKVVEPEFVVVSGADETWRYSLQPPGDERWLNIGFDDRSWQPMAKKATPKLDRKSHGAYALNRTGELKASCLGVVEGEQSPAPQPSIWIRTIFTVPAPLGHSQA